MPSRKLPSQRAAHAKKVASVEKARAWKQRKQGLDTIQRRACVNFVNQFGTVEAAIKALKEIQDDELGPRGEDGMTEGERAWGQEFGK